MAETLIQWRPTSRKRSSIGSISRAVGGRAVGRQRASGWHALGTESTCMWLDSGRCWGEKAVLLRVGVTATTGNSWPRVQMASKDNVGHNRSSA